MRLNYKQEDTNTYFEDPTGTRESTKTGDETPLLTWTLVLIGAAAIGAAEILRIRRKKKYHS